MAQLEQMNDMDREVWKVTLEVMPIKDLKVIQNLIKEEIKRRITK